MSNGRFGLFGGQYIPETLMNEIHRLEKAYAFYKQDEEFQRELKDLLDNYANRPSLLYYAGKMTEDLGGAKIYLKREDLNHTGAHKINNALGQCLLAKKMGKTRVIAETGAGQHGVATATAAAFMGLECEVFMGEEDTIRQALNVYRMELLGAKVHAVTTGTKVLKDAVNEAMREWVSRVDDTHYVIGSTMGPHPFPTRLMVPRLPVRHQPGSAGADFGTGRKASGSRAGLRRRRQQCHGHVLPLHRRRIGTAHRLRSCRQGHRYEIPRRDDFQRQRRYLPRHEIDFLPE